MKSSPSIWFRKKSTVRKGFTLVELLTVIAIVAILAAIVLPSLGKIRGKSEAAICASNLRNLFTAYGAYANERNSAIMPSYRYLDYANNPGYTRDYTLNWIHALCKYQYIGAPDKPADTTGDPYTKYSRLCFFYSILGCPTVQNYRLSTQGALDGNGNPIPCTQTGWITYGANLDLTNLNDANNRSGRFFTELAQPSRTILIADKDMDPPTGNYYFIAGRAGLLPGAVHDGMANILYADGHVEAVDPTDEKAVPTNEQSRDYKLIWLGNYGD